MISTEYRLNDFDKISEWFSSIERVNQALFRPLTWFYPLSLFNSTQRNGIIWMGRVRSWSTDKWMQPSVTIRVSIPDYNCSIFFYQKGGHLHGKKPKENLNRYLLSLDKKNREIERLKACVCSICAMFSSKFQMKSLILLLKQNKLNCVIQKEMFDYAAQIYWG